MGLHSVESVHLPPCSEADECTCTVAISLQKLNTKCHWTRESMKWVGLSSPDA